MKPFFLLIVAVAFAGVSCERHEFEETKKLHEGHGDHGADHSGEHSSDHSDHAH